MTRGVKEEEKVLEGKPGGIFNIFIFKYYYIIRDYYLSLYIMNII